MSASTIETPLVGFDYPDDWRVHDETEGALAIIVAPVPAGAFQANVVLTAVESSAPLPDAAVAAITAAHMQHPGSQVIADDVWSATATPGRRVMFTYPVPPSGQVDVRKWVWATGTHHIHLSASSAPYQSDALSRTVDAIAASVRLRGMTAGNGEATVESAVELDETASERAGMPLESVAWVVRRQRLTIEAPTIPEGALEMLAAGAPRQRLSRADAASPAADILRAERVVDARGRFTDVARIAASHWAHGHALLDVRMRSAHVEGRLRMWRGTDSVLVAATAPLGAMPLPPQHVQLWTSSLDRAPAALTGWLALAPAWSFDDGAWSLAPELLDEHLVEPGAAPDAGTEVPGWWSPWTQVEIGSPAGELALVRTGDGAWLRRTPREGEDRVESWPTSRVADTLGRLFLSVAADRSV